MLLECYWSIVFLAEKRARVQQETGCNSMSRISKMLGGMWTTLTKEEKEVCLIRGVLVWE